MSSQKTTKGLMLRSVESVLIQVANFVLQLFLARLLIPEDFGVVAILATFVNLANTVVNNGLGSAILQKKEADDLDVCTVFYVELGLGVLMYGLIFLAAPYIAVFYENPQITAYLRVFGVTILLGALSSIQLTVGRYRLDFTPSLVSNVAAVAAQAAVGIFMALGGYGVWSLVISQVVSYTVRVVLLTALTRWMPSLEFSISRLKNMFSYSWKLFAGWMIGTLYQDVFAWVIGKKYDTQTLGYYSKGNSIPSIVNKVVTQVTTAVMFPAIAKNQDNRDLVKQQTRVMLSVSAALVFMVMAGLAGAADTFVRIVLTEKWLGSVPVIQIMSIPLALNVISNANMQSFNAVGRSDLFLRLEIIKRGATILLVIIFSNINYYLMLFSIGIGGWISIVANAISNKKIFHYSYREYAADLLPYVICAVALFLGVSACNYLPLNIYLRMVLQLALCAGVFFGLIFSGVLPAFRNIRQVIFSMLKRK